MFISKTQIVLKIARREDRAVRAQEPKSQRAKSKEALCILGAFDECRWS